MDFPSRHPPLWLEFHSLLSSWWIPAYPPASSCLKASAPYWMNGWMNDSTTDWPCLTVTSSVLDSRPHLTVTSLKQMRLAGCPSPLCCWQLAQVTCLWWREFGKAAWCTCYSSPPGGNSEPPFNNPCFTFSSQKLPLVPWGFRLSGELDGSCHFPRPSP